MTRQIYILSKQINMVRKKKKNATHTYQLCYDSIPIRYKAGFLKIKFIQTFDRPLMSMIMIKHNFDEAIKGIKASLCYVN